MERKELTDSNLRRLFGGTATWFVFFCFFFSMLCFGLSATGSYLNKKVTDANDGFMPMVWEVPGESGGPSIAEQEQGIHYPRLADRYCTQFSALKNAPEWLLRAFQRVEIAPTNHCIPTSIGDIIGWLALPLWLLASISWLCALGFAIRHQIQTTLPRPVLAISTFVSLAFFSLGAALVFFLYLAVHSHASAIIVPH